MHELVSVESLEASCCPNTIWPLRQRRKKVLYAFDLCKFIIDTQLTSQMEIGEGHPKLVG